MIGQPFVYNKIFRKTTVAFGALFSNLTIDRTDANGNVSQSIQVPLAYSGKDKNLVRVMQDPTLNAKTKIDLPRMAFEISGYQYDPSRTININNTISTNGSPIKSPAPYNISYTMYVMTKTLDDGLAIIEQIVPHFMPEVTVAIDYGSGQIINVPFILTGISISDTFDGKLEETRVIIHTLTFNVKTYVWAGINNNTETNGVIKRVIVDTHLQAELGEVTGESVITYTAEVVPFDASATDQYTIEEIFEER